MKNAFKTCPHNATDWRECFQCLDEVAMQLAIARVYLKEIAQGAFNDNGDCTAPVAEPVRGRSFQQIAARGLSAASD